MFLTPPSNVFVSFQTYLLEFQKRKKEIQTISFSLYLKPILIDQSIFDSGLVSLLVVMVFDPSCSLL